MTISVAYRTSFRNAVLPCVQIREYYDEVKENMEEYARREAERTALDLLEHEKPEAFEGQWDTAEFEEQIQRFKEKRVGYHTDVLRRRVTIFEK